jgi:hypothetical protein
MPKRVVIVPVDRGRVGKAGMTGAIVKGCHAQDRIVVV